jgi:hypothetical protein
MIWLTPLAGIPVAYASAAWLARHVRLGWDHRARMPAAAPLAAPIRSPRPVAGSQRAPGVAPRVIRGSIER